MFKFDGETLHWEGPGLHVLEVLLELGRCQVWLQFGQKFKKTIIKQIKRGEVHELQSLLTWRDKLWKLGEISYEFRSNQDPFQHPCIWLGLLQMNRFFFSPSLPWKSLQFLLYSYCLLVSQQYLGDTVIGPAVLDTIERLNKRSDLAQSRDNRRRQVNSRT